MFALFVFLCCVSSCCWVHTCLEVNSFMRATFGSPLFGWLVVHIGCVCLFVFACSCCSRSVSGVSGSTMVLIGLIFVVLDGWRSVDVFSRFVSPPPLYGLIINIPSWPMSCVRNPVCRLVVSLVPTVVGCSTSYTPSHIGDRCLHKYGQLRGVTTPTWFHPALATAIRFFFCL